MIDRGHPTPTISIPGEKPFFIDTSDGHTLEALLRLPTPTKQVVIACPPHPLHGGTMHNVVTASVVDTIAHSIHNAGTLRFNYRGVGRSTGQYADGNGETVDVISAVDGILNMIQSVNITIVGYSFGSWVGLRAAWAHPEVNRIALISPATRIFTFAEETECRRPLPSEIVVGDCDRFAPTDSVRNLAHFLGANLHTIKRADHFLVGHEPTVAALLLPFVQRAST